MARWKRLGMLSAFGLIVIGAASSAAYFASRPSGPPSPTNAPGSNSTAVVSEPQGAHFVRVSPEQAQREEEDDWRARGMDSAADASAAANAATQAAETAAPVDSPPEDHRWYVIGLRFNQCILVSEAFGVSTPHDVQKLLAGGGHPLDTIKDEGGTADGAIVMLGDADHPLLNPIAFVKGKGECFIAMRLIQAQVGALESQ